MKILIILIDLLSNMEKTDDIEESKKMVSDLFDENSDDDLSDDFFDDAIGKLKTRNVN